MGYNDNTNRPFIQIDNKEINDKIGLLSDLKTTDKSSLVNATNENTSQLADISANLSDQDSQISTLQHGLNVITTDQASPTAVRLFGRTLVNLLGKDGNFENGNVFDSNSSLDNSNYKYGNSSNKIDNSAGTIFKTSQTSAKYQGKGKLVLFGGWIKTGSDVVDGANILIGNGSNYTTDGYFETNYVSTTSWKFVYSKADLTNWNNEIVVRIALRDYGSINDIANFDGLFIYEIPQSIYDAIDVDAAYTGDALAAKFPYVDSVQHTMNPYVKNYGKNLIPPLTSGKWTLHANDKVIDDYSLELDATADWQGSYIDLPALPNQPYTLSANNGMYMYIQLIGAEGSLIRQTYVGSGVDKVTDTTTVDTKTIRIVFDNGQLRGTFTSSNPQLELGSTATAFEPQNESYLYVAQDADKNPISLASNNDGSVADEVYLRDNQWYRLNRFMCDKVLDGTLSWAFGADFSGFKELALAFATDTFKTEITNYYGNLVKFDGKIVNRIPSGSESSGDQWVAGGGSNQEFYVNISDTDSGWGDTYTPSTDEIKAYFYGWKMNNGTFGTAYAGTGTKTWVPIGDTDNTRATTVLPTADAPTIVEGKIDHYKLTYQLAQATEESIEVEGSLDLIDGGNQIELGEGVQVTTNADGSQTITFIADNAKYNQTSAINKIEVNYNTNIKTVINQLVQSLEDDETDISILKIQMINVLARLQAGGL